MSAIAPGIQVSTPLLGVFFFVGLLVFFFLLGRFSAGDGSDLIDWDPSKRIDSKRAAERDDIDQMLAMANRRRRAQGLPDLTETEVMDQLHRESH